MIMVALGGKSGDQGELDLTASEKLLKGTISFFRLKLVLEVLIQAYSSLRAASVNAVKIQI